MKNFIRIALGIAMIFAGIGHLSFVRETFQVQVPDWIPFSKDFVVIASGIVEICFVSRWFFWLRKNSTWD